MPVVTRQLVFCVPVCHSLYLLLSSRLPCGLKWLIQFTPSLLQFRGQERSGNWRKKASKTFSTTSTYTPLARVTQSGGLYLPLGEGTCIHMWHSCSSKVAKEKERLEISRELAVSAPGKSSESVKLNRGQWPSTGLHDSQLSLDRAIPPTLLGNHFTSQVSFQIDTSYWFLT